jgi:hypothetical protein
MGLTSHRECSLHSSQPRQPCVSRLANMELVLAWNSIFSFSPTCLTNSIFSRIQSYLPTPRPTSIPSIPLTDWPSFTYLFPALHHNSLKANPFYLYCLFSEARPSITALANPWRWGKGGASLSTHNHLKIH